MKLTMISLIRDRKVSNLTQSCPFIFQMNYFLNLRIFQSWMICLPGQYLWIISWPTFLLKIPIAITLCHHFSMFQTAMFTYLANLCDRFRIHKISWIIQTISGKTMHLVLIWSHVFWFGFALRKFIFQFDVF